MALAHLGVRWRPILGGLSWVPGSLTLITLRWLLIILSSLPAVAGTLQVVASSAARRPHFTDHAGRLPGVHLMQLAQELPPMLLATACVVILLALLGQQLLMAGALTWLAPSQASRPGDGAVFRTVLATGTSWIWTMLRVVLTAIVLGGLGIQLILYLFEALGLHGEGARWTGRTLLTVLPMLQGLGIALWLALVGSWAFWCRVVLVGDGRRLVRSAGVMVLRIWYRHPLRSALFYLAATSLVLILSGALLISWRQYPPGSITGAIAWQVAWLFGLLLQAIVWHWLIRSALLLYDDESMADLRAEPDAPWGVLPALRGLVRWPPWK